MVDCSQGPSQLAMHLKPQILVHLMIGDRGIIAGNFPCDGLHRWHGSVRIEAVIDEDIDSIDILCHIRHS